MIPPSLADAPLIEKPDEPYTNEPKVDLVGTIPEGAAGIDGNRIRIYVAIGEGEPGVVTEIPVGRTVRFVVPDITLADGSNAFTATIVSDAGESDPSPVVTYVFDATIPRIVVSKPRDGAVVNAKTASIDGETQARSEVRVWNATSNLTVVGAADENGKFAIVPADRRRPERHRRDGDRPGRQRRPPRDVGAEGLGQARGHAVGVGLHDQASRGCRSG